METGFDEGLSALALCDTTSQTGMACGNASIRGAKRAATRGARSFGTFGARFRCCAQVSLIVAGLAACTSSPPPNDPASFGPSGFPTPPPPPDAVLTAADVNNIVLAAAAAVNDETMIIAVTDRQGNVLALYRKPNAPATTNLGTDFGFTVNANDQAISLAHTAGFFSNDQAPLSSRTVRYISGIHFPPGVMNQPNADLYGIENTNRGCQLVPPANFLPGQALPTSTALAGGPGLGIATGKADLMDSNPIAVNPGGVPIFKNNPAGQPNAVGGVGVVASNLDVAEFAAFSGAFSPGFGVTSLPPPGVVIVGGIALPFVTNTTRPAGFMTGTADGAYVPLAATSLVPATATTRDSSGPVPEGDLIAPAAGPVGGLTAAQVTEILNAGEAVANATRGVIRLPLGSRAHMVFAVADLDGTLIGLRRMRDATIFSVDVASGKARNMVYFNSAAVAAADLPGVPPGTAVTNRTISFSSMPLFPPGIDGQPAGPTFQLFVHDVQNPCTQGSQAPPVMGPTNQSGIVFFPGSVGIYDSTGKLLGGFGVSGDGVDQDDFVTTGGASGGINANPTCTGANCYLPPASVMRADQFCVTATGAMASCGGPGVRLPFSKFPRDPTN
jgi:uncharacterized protein GlcG (DUF336 family)